MVQDIEASSQEAQPAEAQTPTNEDRTTMAPQEATAPPKVDRASVRREDIREDFQPFYEKEARTDRRTKIVSESVLFALLVGLGLGLIGLTVETLLLKTPCRLQVVTIAVICFALIGFLWKSTTLATRVGLAVLSVWGVLAVTSLFCGAVDLGFWRLSGSFIQAVLFCLALAAVLLTIWTLWPTLHWLPVALSVLVLYTALAPVSALVEQGMNVSQDYLLGPSMMAHWPIFLRPGYLMAQVMLPVGVILLLIHQSRTIFRGKYRTHWGFAYWALALVLSSAVGLIALERADQPVFPSLNRIAAQLSPETTLLTPATDQPATALPAVPLETPTATESPSGGTPAVGGEGQAAQEDLQPGPETAPPSVAETDSQAELETLRERVTTLESQLKALQELVHNQDQMIRSLFNYLGSESKRPAPSEQPKGDDKPAPPKGPERATPDVPEPPSTDPGEKIPQRTPYQDYT